MLKEPLMHLKEYAAAAVLKDPLPCWNEGSMGKLVVNWFGPLPSGPLGLLDWKVYSR